MKNHGQIEVASQTNGIYRAKVVIKLARIMIDLIIKTLLKMMTILTKTNT